MALTLVPVKPKLDTCAYLFLFCCCVKGIALTGISAGMLFGSIELFGVA